MFLRYVGGIPSEDTFVKKLQDKVEDVRKNKDWRREYHDTVNERLGEPGSRQEGLEKGEQNAKIGFVKTLLQEGSFPCEKIASIAQVPLEKVLELRAKQLL